jgi:hypothetical protein
LQKKEGCAYWGENKRAAAIFCRKEKVVPIGERINVPIREKRICLDVFGSDTKLKHKL